MVDLARDYGLTVAELVPHTGGFATDGWVVDGRWFVKVWQAGEKPEGLTQLGELRAQGLPVVEPLRTLQDEPFALSGTRAYAVFPYVEGRTADWGDWRAVARALRRVHEVSPAQVTLPPADVSEPHIRS
ncbi:phosphotransferase [Kribbella sp. NPDC048915]|uniref:phosphotransferase n=1 Tax=Kribbella sp. NPDC048915 TaxID=3155148 RepID=UPI003401083E